MRMIWIVYEVWDLEANIPFYVGKTYDIKAREKQHINASTYKKNGAAFLKKLKSMRDNNKPYSFKKVYESHDESEAIEKERHLIAYYGRRDLGNGPLLNLTDGGEGTSGRIPSSETRALWSSQRSGRPAWNIGKRYSHANPSPKKGKGWSDIQKAQHAALTPEQKAARLEKRRATIAAKGGERSVAQQAADKAHSARMRGEGNPHFGVPGWNAGQAGTGPWAGRTGPNKGRKKGPDGKLYSKEEYIAKFGDNNE